MANNKNGEASSDGDLNARLETTPGDQTKGRKWFDRARELGDKRNFDHAIEYYVSGLEFWPDAVEEACRPLHGCAVARRQTGGKKPGLKDTMKRSVNDKDPKKAYMNSLWLFGHDPDNLAYVEGVAKNASRLRAEDAAFWSGGLCLKALESSPKPNAKQFQALLQLAEELGDRAAAREESEFAQTALQLGIEVLNLWRRKIPKDDTVEMAVKNLSTKLTILKGKYQKSESFRDSITDIDEQRDLHDEQRSVQSVDRLGELIAKAQLEYEAEPDSDKHLQHLSELLCRRETEPEELRAIAFLLNHFKRTDDYRWKMAADDVRMKQLGRSVRELSKGGDKAAIKESRIKQLRFELGVYKERIDRYPTDIRLRFEYGVRNFQAGRFDEAIPLFQAARTDPKNRAACGMYLGRCFFRKNYHDQAVEALSGAVQEHPLDDDDMGKTVRYWLARAQEASGDGAGARKTYGNLLQLDYNFGDVRARLDALPASG